MKVLIGHNYYQSPGGEDAVVKSECQLLKDFGEDVALYERHNSEMNNLSAVARMKALWTLGHSGKTYREMRSLIRKFQPDVAHFHNIFFMITPAAYFACKDEGVPVIQSQHNFRLLCSNALFYRDNKACEDCLDKTLWEGVKHRCYKNSYLFTGLLVRTLMQHWKRKTWTDMIDMYIVAAEFTRQKYIQGGIPADKIMIKPHFIHPDPGQNSQHGEYALYVGRLSREKGVDVLLKAWRHIHDIPLKIMGDGEMALELKEYAKDMNNVEFLGFVSNQEYDQHMRGAKFLAVPSVCYENFPRIVAEAYAYGIPMITSRLGSLAELIVDGKTGLTFEPGDARDLAQKVKWMCEHELDLQQMREMARYEYEQKYTATENYKTLMSIYNKAIASQRTDLKEGLVNVSK